MADNVLLNDKEIEKLYGKIKEVIDVSRGYAYSKVNEIQILSNLLIGKYIVEEEQQGETRAQYGKKVLIQISKKLTDEYGRGYSVNNLTRMRNFYNTYWERISPTVLAKFENQKSTTMMRIFDNKEFPFKLSWSHYLLLMRIENKNERNFYEIEALEGNWDVRTLQRQYNSSLYERLALSRDKEGILELAQKEIKYINQKIY